MNVKLKLTNNFIVLFKKRLKLLKRFLSLKTVNNNPFSQRKG